MSRRILISAAFLAFVAGCSSSKGPTTPLLPNPAATVEMHWHSFNPSTVTIKEGETVQWHNVSMFHHTVTCDPSKAQNKDDAALPAGVAPWDSGDIADDYQHTFTTAGTYKYFCIPHESHGMIGQVIVEPTVKP